MEFQNYKLERNSFASVTLSPCHVAYANTLRRLIMTGVESAGFRADLVNGTTSDVTVEANDTPMTDEMLAHRIGLLPIHIAKPLDADLASLQFSIDVKAHKDRFRDVTCKDFVITKDQEGGLEPVVLEYDQFFPEDPITRDTCLIATLAPGEGRIALKAKASLGTGRENARFQPTSQCAYTYTRDDDRDKIETHFRDWLRRVKNRSFAFEEMYTLAQGRAGSEANTKPPSTSRPPPKKVGDQYKLPGDRTLNPRKLGDKYKSPDVNAASAERVKATNSLEGVSPTENVVESGLEENTKEFDENEKIKLAEFRREYETMEIAKVYLKDEKGEPYSYDFTIETVGPLSIPYIVRRACDVGEAMMAKYSTVDTESLPTDNKLRVIPSQSRVIGFDFVMKEQDHTFGNMVQTWLEQNHIYEEEQKADGPIKISYAGYEVPHPLRDEMVLRIGATSRELALGAFAQACRGCVSIFQQMREAWGRAVPEAGLNMAKEKVAKATKNAAALEGARNALKKAVAPEAEAEAEAPPKAPEAKKPAVGLRRTKSGV
jgi:hypothetical protein